MNPIQCPDCKKFFPLLAFDLSELNETSFVPWCCPYCDNIIKIKEFS